MVLKKRYVMYKKWIKAKYRDGVYLILFKKNVYSII